MKKYLLVMSNSWQTYFAYRVNFFLWRVRAVIFIIISFYLWLTIFQGKNQLFNYSQAQILTYILLINIISSIVLSTQTFKVAEEINYGKLSNILLWPINYFGYILARDVSDKIINTFFSFFEITILITLLRPPIFLQTNTWYLSWSILAVISATLLYFEIGLLLSFIGFWSKETWAPRFIFFILVAFLAGTYFPLDILPAGIYTILQLLPFSYLVYFPIKIYLGQVDNYFIFLGFTAVFFWIFVLWILSKIIWRKGLKVYTSEGR